MTDDHGACWCACLMMLVSFFEKNTERFGLRVRCAAGGEKHGSSQIKSLKSK
jgi:hypothetical protein